MISIEKIINRFNIFFKDIFYHLFFWYCSFLVFHLLAGNENLINSNKSFFQINTVYFTILIYSTSLSVLFSFFDFIFTDRILRFSPSRFIIVFRIIAYLTIAIIIILYTEFSTENKFFEGIKTNGFKELSSKIDLSALRFLAFFLLCSFFNNFISSVIKRIGRSNFWLWSIGLLNKPREVERIFMFIDMKSSTTIAEKIHHKKFSHLVQDVFMDMAIVDNYLGEIYQYLGDGAIISWSLKNGTKNQNCIQFFYSFTRIIEKRSRYYQRKYGLTPGFKAGIHVGKVMVLQVGKIRRDISYNGDALNTTARIESKCGELKKDLLISGALYHMLDENPKFKFKHIDTTKLKGKTKATDIYEVNKVVN
ncbi:MAG: adenylate/guanylate cyclase domain-containing protein [Bacteroidales bacterium]|nr:adenylate/guanylate cyclase domain-containing protein [Bacteroidales bacterium]MBN2819694.1 adenylate/guanylate cyclase domain-containing protein [Bacteroidales bacterium]